MKTKERLHNLRHKISQKTASVEKRTNKDIKIECADSSDLNDEYSELKTCDSIYDISPDDYNMYVLEKENVYFVILEGTGKFENIDLTYAWEEIAKSSIFPLNHLVDFNISIEENYDKSALLTMLSPFGEVLDIMTTGANDVYVIKGDDGKEYLFPSIKECILDVDLEQGIVTVHILKGLLDL